MELLLVGVALLVSAGPLFWFSLRQERLASGILGAGINSVAELQEIYTRVHAEMGRGVFAQRVAIQGLLECEQPLTSEIGALPCAAFRYAVTRRWEETVRERDEQGRLRSHTRTGSERVASNERRVSFWVRDEGGRLLVHPEGASVEMETMVDRFEPADGRASPLRFGRVELDFGRGGHRRTVGYHINESILPIGRAVYVLGTASDHTGTLSICPMPGAGERFMISLRTREQLLHAARQNSTILWYAAAGCVPVGAVLIVLGLASLR